MSYPLSHKSHLAALKLNDEQRYRHFVEKVAAHGEIWSLANDEGWVTVSSDGDNAFPVWPHPDYAREWAQGEWADCAPKAVALDVWLDRWTAGLIADETWLVVFPNLKEQALMVEPQDLDDALRDARM
tara:strand:+ start:114 stop:497 length:384 start_codon:yes stop_codon:yes gene_type:complete